MLAMLAHCTQSFTLVAAHERRVADDIAEHDRRQFTRRIWREGIGRTRHRSLPLDSIGPKQERPDCYPGPRHSAKITIALRRNGGVEGGSAGHVFRLVVAIGENTHKSASSLLVALPWLKALAYAAFEAASQIYTRRPLLNRGRWLGGSEWGRGDGSPKTGRSC